MTRDGAVRADAVAGVRGPARVVAILSLLLAATCAEGRDAATGGASRTAGGAGRVCGASGACLAQRGFGPARADALVVVLHGDVPPGPVTYHQIVARRVVASVPGVAAVALTRPGYADDSGPSDGERRGAGTVPAIAGAIAALRARTGARRVVAIGHSGGANAIVGVLEGHPGVLDGAVLLACSCRGATARVAAGGARPAVLLMTGTADTGSPPAVAEPYAAALAARGVPARFVGVPGATHDTIVEAAWRAGLGEALAAMTR